ncbi:MAG: hypothetical protein GYA15_08965 [Leptolinea sp.]|jgi:hypothetical protein|nr:hypothetical protein [Leptolinea sp.]
MKTISEKKLSELLVLVPEGDLDEVRYAKKARALAKSYHLDTTYIGMVQSADSEMETRRKLIRLSSLTEIDDVQSEFFLEKGSTWPDIVAHHFKPGDHLLCPRELEDALIKSRQDQSLRGQYGLDVSLVTGMIPPSRDEKLEHWLLNMLNWAGILLILSIAFILEINFDRQTIGALRITGDVMIAGLEVIVLVSWYKLFQKIHN